MITAKVEFAQFLQKMTDIINMIIMVQKLISGGGLKTCQMTTILLSYKKGNVKETEIITYPRQSRRGRVELVQIEQILFGIFVREFVCDVILQSGVIYIEHQFGHHLLWIWEDSFYHLKYLKK